MKFGPMVQEMFVKGKGNGRRTDGMDGRTEDAKTIFLRLCRGIKTRSEVKVTVTRKWYATLLHPKMHPHTTFGVPASKDIEDMRI